MVSNIFIFTPIRGVSWSNLTCTYFWNGLVQPPTRLWINIHFPKNWGSTKSFTAHFHHGIFPKNHQVLVGNPYKPFLVGNPYKPSFATGILGRRPTQGFGTMVLSHKKVETSPRFSRLSGLRPRSRCVGAKRKTTMETRQATLIHVNSVFFFHGPF